MIEAALPNLPILSLFKCLVAVIRYSEKLSFGKNGREKEVSLCGLEHFIHLLLDKWLRRMGEDSDGLLKEVLLPRCWIPCKGGLFKVHLITVLCFGMASYHL